MVVERWFCINGGFCAVKYTIIYIYTIMMMITGAILRLRDEETVKASFKNQTNDTIYITLKQ